MEQRDYLERQIEALGKVLRNMMHWLATGELPSSSEALSQSFQEKLELPLSYFDPDALRALLDEPAWDEQNLETLVRCYLTLANRSDQDVAGIALQCARSILLELEERADTYSFDRAAMLERVELQMIEYGLR